MRKPLLSAAMLATLAGVAQAGPDYPNRFFAAPAAVPPSGFSRAAPVELANPRNSPLTGADILGAPYGGRVPPSLQTLMNLRPGVDPRFNLKPARAEELRQAGLAYGAAGGLAAFAFANNETLRQRQAQLDQTVDARFRQLVLPVAGEQTLIVPPVVSEQQMAFALGDNGRVAHESNRIYRISNEARLTAAPPTWRSYLVQDWPDPVPPEDPLRPHTDDEAKCFAQSVAEGWARGWKQGDEIFQDRLALLETDIVGVARYRILLNAGLVQQPRIAVLRAAAKGRGDMVRYGDSVTRITGDASLTGGAVRHRQALPPGPIAPVPGPGLAR